MMTKLKKVKLPAEPDPAVEHDGRLWRVRIKRHRLSGQWKIQISVAALNDDLTVHECAGFYTITDPHVITYSDATKSNMWDLIDRVIMQQIEECQRRLENQQQAITIEENWND